MCVCVCVSVCVCTHVCVCARMCICHLNDSVLILLYLDDPIYIYIFIVPR